MKGKIICASAMLLCASGALQAARHAPFERSRIYWDQSTLCYPLPGNGNYGRMVQLLDGRLMVVGSYNNGLAFTTSSDYGATWSTPQMIITHPEGFRYGSPDFTQLSDGTLLVGLNPRPQEPFSTDRRFGIRVIRSTDLGKSWSEPAFVYDASHQDIDGCWEPSFLELPSGEVHCYFSNEGVFTTTSEQDIEVSRSFDGGETWSTPERVCYRTGTRDGMPSAIITDNNDIVVIVEDYGHSGYVGFKPTTVRCTLEQNWHDFWVSGNSPNRHMIFANEADKKYRCGAPYIRKLANGETVASWMGESDATIDMSLDYYHMSVAVGDEDALNFVCVNDPFSVSAGGCANWASLGVADDGCVYALANYREGTTYKGLGLVKGTPRKGFEADYGTPKLDGIIKGDHWTDANGRQVTMGAQMNGRVEMDFLYDRENLYFYAYVKDQDIVKEVVDKDGVYLYLDLEGCCDTYPQKGMFRYFFDVDGGVEMRRGDSNKWQPAEIADGIEYKLICGSKYYMMEVAIPWKLMGYDAVPSSTEMRVNVSVRDRRKNSIFTETIPDALDKSSWTWPEFMLNPLAGVDNAVVPAGKKAVMQVSGGLLTVMSDREISRVEAYATSGVLAASAAECSLPLPGNGLYIVRVRYADGSVECGKVVY